MTPMSDGDLHALGLTLELALITTVLLLILGTPLAWWLARVKRSWFKSAVEITVALPLVLPPTVLGFYLLLFLGPHGPLASVFQMFGIRSLAFSFTGLIVGSMVYSLPFVVRPLQSGFSAIDPKLFEAAACLRASRWDRFLSIALPLNRSAYLTAAVLGFAHTVGEFGVVLMIGGNIPGQTRVLSLAIYEHVEMLEYGQAHVLSLLLLGISFIVLALVQRLTQKVERA
jgi:molybdate transport system permease protein